MQLAERVENAGGVAPAGIQAAVSLGDAFTEWALYRGSRGQGLAGVVALIAQSESQRAPEVAKLIQKILDRKRDVEYGDREVQMSDARQIGQDPHKLSNRVRDALAD